MGDKDCELCQSSGCKMFGAYVLLCIVAIIAYYILVPALTINGKEPDKAVLIMGLLAWTAAMIVPITAAFAINNWREQNRASSYSEFAKEVISRKSDVMISIVKLQKKLILGTVEYAGREQSNLPQLDELIKVAVNFAIEELIDQQLHSYMLKIIDLQLLLDDKTDVLILENSIQELHELVRKFGDALIEWRDNPLDNLTFTALNAYLIKLDGHGEDVQALCKKYITHAK